MTVLVTGGAGYVGSALVPELLAIGKRVKVLDWFAFRAEEEISSHPALTLVKGDIRDILAVKEALSDVDVVIHLAAMSNDPSGDLNKQLTRAINHEATCTLVRECRNSGVSRFINASSASVYGVCHDPQVVESLPLNPQTVYAETKASSEAFVLGQNSRSFTTVSVRPATLHGYAERLRLDLTANIFVSQAVSTGVIKVFGGNQYRPNLSVLDMVRAYVLLIDAPAHLIGGKTFNVAESDHTVREIAEIVRSSVDLDVQLALTESSDTRSYRLCADLLRETLGFEPQFTLHQSASDLAHRLSTWTQSEISSPRFRNVEWLKRFPQVLAQSIS